MKLGRSTESEVHGHRKRMSQLKGKWQVNLSQQNFCTLIVLTSLSRIASHRKFWILVAITQTKCFVPHCHCHDDHHEKAVAVLSMTPYRTPTQMHIWTYTGMHNWAAAQLSLRGAEKPALAVICDIDKHLFVCTLNHQRFDLQLRNSLRLYNDATWLLTWFIKWTLIMARSQALAFTLESQKWTPMECPSLFAKWTGWWQRLRGWHCQYGWHTTRIAIVTNARCAAKCIAVQIRNSEHSAEDINGVIESIQIK